MSINVKRKKSCNFVAPLPTNPVRPTEYIVSNSLSVAISLVPLEDSLAFDVQALFGGQGVSEPMQFAVVSASRAATECKLEHRISGLYFALRREYDGRPCYQKVYMSPNRPGTLTCKSLYIFWSCLHGCWKLGPTLNDGIAGYAYCTENAMLEDVKGPWMVLENAVT